MFTTEFATRKRALFIVFRLDKKRKECQWSNWNKHVTLQLGQIAKTRQKWDFLKNVTLTGYPYASNSSTNFWYDAHAMTGNGSQVNFLKFAGKFREMTLWWTYFFADFSYFELLCATVCNWKSTTNRICKSFFRNAVSCQKLAVSFPIPQLSTQKVEVNFFFFLLIPEFLYIPYR